MGFARAPAVEALRRARGALPEAVQLLLDDREGRQLSPEPHGALRPAVARSCSGEALRDGHFADQAHRTSVHHAYTHNACGIICVVLTYEHGRYSLMSTAEHAHVLRECVTHRDHR